MPFFKLWKTSPVADSLIPPPEYDDDDSFFDLELNYESKQLNLPKSTAINSSDSDEDDESFESRSPISFWRSPAKIPSFFTFKKKTSSGAESPATTPATPVFSRANSSRRKIQGPKEVMCKYMKLIKVRVSRSSGEVTGEISPESPSSKVAEDRQRSPSMLIVSRRLGKSRSAITSAGISQMMSVSGDFVLQNDGIQSAILHCKSSYSSSKDLSVLSRSVSEPVISANPTRFSIEEKKRISI